MTDRTFTATELHELLSGEGTAADKVHALYGMIIPVLQKRPTLADMTEEERAACQWMQADILGGDEPLVIAHIDRSDGTALILDQNGIYDETPAGAVTPRPDLPRLEWPGEQQSSPALPEGWRLADHREHGRVIATNTTPGRDGYVYFTFPDDDLLGHEWHFGDPDELTYLDQGADQ